VIARSVRTDRYRFTLWERPAETVGVELYDYQNDPQGNVNLAASPENKKLVQKLIRMHRSEWPNQY
jgi:iduronate 2-sulfatase